MSKITQVIIAAASLALSSMGFATDSLAGSVLDKVLETKTMTVATSFAWPKSSFMNEKHELDGFEIEVAKGIAEKLGVQAKFVTPDWDVIVSGKWDGRWDLAMGQMTPTKDRAEKFNFVVYVYSREVAIVHKDSKSTKLSDLDGKVVGTTTGDTGEAYAHHKLILNFEGAKPVEYKFTPGSVRTFQTTDLILADLRLGDGVRLDAVLCDEPSAVEAIKAGYPLKVLDEPLYSAPGAIAILKGDTAFEDKIAAAVKAMRDDGTLSKLSIKWYGADTTVE
ncbi:amino acid ABC transporter substrate-binding protein [Mesorhizobium sp. WSM3866]|uniref:transporter substrate-binding domain-containing protein n=1 Tax=Mesorhizobium sp. WSM3866 TaxID=422271 RepID=UPI000BAE87C9|nr:transporter substrate-binding domain-containing protein [Mesorhizobium sp. WSM3866]PBB41197.1 amino acid ABC transporter substrate-binding protein [Mesorhizobium sp. WSM3866]